LAQDDDARADEDERDDSCDERDNPQAHEASVSAAGQARIARTRPG
jgi:hypothetical protein